jgi:hypothetical protein
MKKITLALAVGLHLCASVAAQNYNAGPLHINGAVYDASAINGSTLSAAGNLAISNGGHWAFNNALIITPRTGTTQAEVVHFIGSGTYSRHTGYVDGYVKAESGASSFVLPIGHSTYMPLTVNTAIAPGNTITAAWYDDRPLASTHISGAQYYFLPGYYNILAGNAGLNVTPSVPLTATASSRMLGTTDGVNFVDLGLAGSSTTLPAGNYQLRFANSSTTLPVTFSDFTATRQGSKSLLQWKLANENGMKEYIVERSPDNRHFISIKSLSSLGQTAQERTYSLYDDAPLDGSNYYRIRMVETSGKESHSPVRLLKFAKAVRIAVFPNPIQDYAAITGLEAGMQVTVINLQGQPLIQKKAVSNAMELNLSQLPGAVYQLQLQDATGKIIGSYQVVKN